MHTNYFNKHKHTVLNKSINMKIEKLMKMLDELGVEYKKPEENKYPYWGEDRLSGIVFFTSKHSGWGFNHVSDYFNNNRWNDSLFTPCSLERAKELLIPHLEANGFVDGVKFKSSHSGTIQKFNKDIDVYKWGELVSNRAFLITGGKLAEIVKEPKLTVKKGIKGVVCGWKITEENSLANFNFTIENISREDYHKIREVDFSNFLEEKINQELK